MYRDYNISDDDTRSHDRFIYYSDGTWLAAAEFNDTMKFGDEEITDVTIGLAHLGDYSRGVLGLQVSETDGYTVLERLVEQNHAKSFAYSFSLDKDATSGSLLIGAVDTSAFDKPLQRLGSRRGPSSYGEFVTYLWSLRYTGRGVGGLEDLRSQESLALLRIRPTDMISNLPMDIAKTIYTVAGAAYDETSGLATIPCSGAKGTTDELVLGLGHQGNTTVRVSFSDLVIPREVFPPDAAKLNRTEDTCLFAIQSASSKDGFDRSSSGWWSLGGVVLRNTYMVFDLVNDELAFAQARFSDKKGSTSDIESFSEYGSQIPQSEAAELCYGYVGCPDNFPGPNSSDEPDNHRLSGGTILLIVLGVVGALAISALIVSCLWRHGSCCFKGMRKTAEARRLAAWGMDPIQLSRPPPPYVPGTMSPHPPPFDETAPTADAATATPGSVAVSSTEVLQPPPYDQASRPPAPTLEANHTNNPSGR